MARQHNESKLQQSCVKWFDYSYPALKMNLFAIPNEGSRSPANGARMKAQGRRAGVADMFLAVSNHYYPIIKDTLCNGLFIEFKYGKGKQNDNQMAFQKAVVRENYRYEVVTDFDSFVNLINEYLN